MKMMDEQIIERSKWTCRACENACEVVVYNGRDMSGLPCGYYAATRSNFRRNVDEQQNQTKRREN